jgi:hypothetical protein
MPDRFALEENLGRRRFLGTVVLTMAAAELVLLYERPRCNGR